MHERLSGQLVSFFVAANPFGPRGWALLLGALLAIGLGWSCIEEAPRPHPSSAANQRASSPTEVPLLPERQAHGSGGPDSVSGPRPVACAHCEALVRDDVKTESTLPPRPTATRDQDVEEVRALLASAGRFDQLEWLGGLTASSALGREQTEAVLELALRSAHPQVRERAALLLARCRPRDLALGGLEELVAQESEPVVRRAGLQSAAILGGGVAERILERSLTGDVDAETRGRCASVMGMFMASSSRAALVLEAAARQENVPEVRGAVLRALGTLGNDGAAEALGRLGWDGTLAPAEQAWARQEAEDQAVLRRSRQEGPEGPVASADLARRFAPGPLERLDPASEPSPVSCEAGLEPGSSDPAQQSGSPAELR